MIDEAFKEEFSKIDISERKFDFFDIIPPKEVLISKWLDFILNPKINGIGNKPLQLLIKLAGSNLNLDDYIFEDSYTELVTNNQKRMDIVLKYNGLWIVIENKIDSLEHDDQTNEYFTYINETKDNNEVIYIYLKPNYNKSKPINDHFNIVTYDKFINELNTIKKEDYIDYNKYKYLNEFIFSGGRFIKNQEIEITDSLKFYIKQIDKFTAIEDEYNSKNKILFNKICDEIIYCTNALDKQYKCYKSGNYIQIYKTNWSNEKHNGVHFEIVFDNSKILGRQLNGSIVLHIEDNISEQQLANFKSINITKDGLQAYLNNEKIKQKVYLDFTSSESIDESINKIKVALLNFISKYENVIDNIMG